MCKIHCVYGSLTNMSPELTSLPMFVSFQYSISKVYTTLWDTTLLKEHSIDSVLQYGWKEKPNQPLSYCVTPIFLRNISSTER